MRVLEGSRLRVVVVPPVPALLPEYAGLTDPVAELREACLDAVSWLLDGAARVESGVARVESGVTRAESGVAQVDSGEAHADSASTFADSSGIGPDSTSTSPDSTPITPDSTSTSPDSTEVRADSPQEQRVGEYLLATAADKPGAGVPASARRVLLLANGSARRGEKAPGHFDPRASGFDEGTGRALETGDAAALAALDLGLAQELLTAGVAGLARLGAELAGGPTPRARLRWAGDPYGVQYWVATWDVDPADDDGRDG